MALVATSALEPSIESASTPKTSFRAAGFFRRATATVLDLFLLIPLLVVSSLGLRAALQLPIPKLGELSPDILLANLFDGSVTNEALLGLSALVPFFYFWTSYMIWGQTPGKRLVRIMVVDVYGDRPSVLRALLRTIGYGLSVLPFSLGVLWIGFDREKRGLHDWLAGTYVVLKP
jgi:uncharacterized RDD family membrane protein YckC